MSNNEAASGLNSHTRSVSNETSGSIPRRYMALVTILFSAVIIFFLSNIAVYKYYIDLKSHLEETFRKMSEYEVSRNDLMVNNEKLENFNKELREKNNAIAAQNEEIMAQMQVIRKINDQLAQKNKELLDDNIELHNSLKKAASVGIKPQNYTTFDGISRSSINRGTYIGEFLGTAYTPSKEECGNDKGITNSGEPIIPGISIAIDSRYWPFGTVFYIKGLGYAVAMDTGSSIKGKYRFDFAVLDRKFALTLGQDYWDVYLVKLGTGKVEELKF